MKTRRANGSRENPGGARDWQGRDLCRRTSLAGSGDEYRRRQWQHYGFFRRWRPSRRAEISNWVGRRSVLIPFDNTTGASAFSTGIAAVTFTHESEQNIPVSLNKITVPANGHVASVLNHDFPEVNGKRGALQLRSNVEIYGLGIRYNGQAFPSIGAIIPT